MSTEEIFNFSFKDLLKCFLLSVLVLATFGCTPEDPGSNKPGVGVVKKKSYTNLNIATQTKLLSIDPLSVNSLGETVLLDYVAPKLFYKSNQKFKSRYGDFTFDGTSLKTKSLVLNKALKGSFLRTKSSTLWSELFKGLSYTDEKGVFCNTNRNCLSTFVSLFGILRSQSLSNYSVKRFVKGEYIKLVKDIKVEDNTPRSFKKHFSRTFKTIKIIGVKSPNDAYKMLLNNTIDVFYPSSSLIDLNSKFFYKYKKGQLSRLSIYYKNSDQANKSFVKLICKSLTEIKKSFSAWTIEKTVCKNSNIRFKSEPNKTTAFRQKISIIGNSKNTIKLIDLIYNKKPKTLKLDYRVLKSSNLTERLRSGDFDFYIDEELYDESYPYLKEAYRSEGKYNTLKYNSKELNLVFDDLEFKTTLEEFFKSQLLVKDILKNTEPFVIRLVQKRPYAVFSNKQIGDLVEPNGI